MFKTIKDDVWAYDVEWVPDPAAGRILYGLDDDGLSDKEILSSMWENGGATLAQPKPFLKTVLCRIVSIAVVRRRTTDGGAPIVDLLSFPRDTSDPVQANEAHILESFLRAVGSRCPQLVGFNSDSADLKIMIQRSVIHGLSCEDFCRRPQKPWEGVDYFARDSEWNIDLMRILGGWGKSTPSLHEMATLSGIPGKLDLNGADVAELWLKGAHDRIVKYNECDALTTYLLWLRVAHFAGKFSQAEYEAEQEVVRSLLLDRIEQQGNEHLAQFLAEWERLNGVLHPSSIHIFRVAANGSGGGSRLA